MNEITYENLTNCQKNAYDAFLEAMVNKTHLTINGPAGTGKTTLTKFIVKTLITQGVRGVYLAAPTHQAKSVLSKLAGIDAQTIHSLLKINPMTYEDTTEFVQSDTPDMADCDVLICDEVSMWDRKLFSILMDTIPSKCVVIGLGDIHQIRPVSPGSTVPELSAFFFNPKFKQVTLDQVVRSNGPIIQVATDIRNGKWIYGNLVDGEGVHDLRIDTDKPVAKFMHTYFDIVKHPNDLFETRMLAFTNKSVDNLNKIIRKKLYQTDVAFINDEVLVMQEPLIKTIEFEGKKFSDTVFHNGEMVRISKCEEVQKTIFLKGIEGVLVIKAWHLNLKSETTGKVGEITTISDEAELGKLQYFLGKAAGQFKEMKGQGLRPAWNKWWEIKNGFKKVKPLPCGTIHKSQGSTIDNAFLYTPCIHYADAQLASQLLYVGATRARNNVYFI